LNGPSEGSSIFFGGLGAAGLPAPGDADYSPEAVAARKAAKKLKIRIISLCAYPKEHVLPGYAMSNHKIYADYHGYEYSVATEKVGDPTRPHAWGKIKLIEN